MKFGPTPVAESGGAVLARAIPGCARSPKENGFDFVLDRILAGILVRSEDIMRMGVGGLLLETAAHKPARTQSDG